MSENSYPIVSGIAYRWWYKYANSWSEAYYADESDQANKGSYIAMGWWARPDGKGDIDRGGLFFDTTALPAGIAISSAKITCLVRFAVTGPPADSTPVADVAKLYRAPGLYYGYPGYKSDYGYLRDCGIYCGGLLITPGMQPDMVACEIPLNAAGIASIVSGDYTIFGIKADSDKAASPPLDTTWRFQGDDFLLVVTYEEAGVLKVVTIAATDVTKNSLTVNGQITQGAATKRGFDWGVSAAALINEWYEEGTFGVEEFSHAVTDLTPGQDFCHRAKAC